MTRFQARKLGIEHTAYTLATAIGAAYHLEPASRIVRDGSGDGVMFSWDGAAWWVVDLDKKTLRGSYQTLAVVTLREADTNELLAEACLASDMDVDKGEWVVNGQDIDVLKELYGDKLVVKWRQTNA